MSNISIGLQLSHTADIRNTPAVTTLHYSSLICHTQLHSAFIMGYSYAMYLISEGRGNHKGSDTSFCSLHCHAVGL